MWLNNESKDALENFWRMAGGFEPYPRQLEKAALLALPVAIIKLPRLALGSIESWLSFRNIHYSFGCSSRPVRGCLLAFQGKGLIFCDGTDLPDEVRFTIAHEISHFLLDHLIPRQKATKLFGISVLEILDGLRKPSISERIGSLLEGTKIGVLTNLMERDNIRNSTEVWKIEEQADRLALELLAPSNDVLAKTNIIAKDFNERLDSITQSLILNFGLPKTIARSYGEDLLKHINQGRSFIEALRASM